MPLYEVSLGYLAIFGLTLARVGGLVTFAPFFGSGAVPFTVRTSLAVVLSWVLCPLVQGSYGAVPEEMVGYTLMLGKELLLGLLIGLIAKMIFAVLEIAGQVMGFQIGFGFIQVIDPQTQVETPFLAIFLNLIGLMILLSLNGHHWLLQAVVESYRLNIGGLEASGSLIEQLIRSSNEMFVVGVKLSAPFLVTLFIVDVLFGLLGRTAPQIHILIVGMPAKSLIGFILLAGLVYSFIPTIGQEIGKLGPQLESYLRLLRG